MSNAIGDDDCVPGRQRTPVQPAAPPEARAGHAATPATKRRANRADRLVGAVLPWSLAAFIVSGSYYVNTTIAWFLWRVRPSHAYTVLYISTFNIITVPLFLLFMYVVLATRKHSAPPEWPPEDIAFRSATYECVDEQGNAPGCWRDDCNGRWMPPRTWHCRTCKTCRLEFDHCCPWLGTCIASDTLKPFMQFLALTPPAILVGMWEVGPIAMSNSSVVYGQLWNSDTMFQNWWSHWYSWIGGPVYRYTIGLYLCFKYYEPTAGDLPTEAHPPIAFAPLFFTTFGALLALMTAALEVVTVLNVLKGTSWADASRKRQQGTSDRLLWQPDHSKPRDEHDRCAGAVVAVAADTQLHARTAREAWQSVFGSTWHTYFAPWPTPQRLGQDGVDAALGAPAGPALDYGVRLAAAVRGNGHRKLA